MTKAKSDLIETLWRRARYAGNSCSNSLIYEALGALHMAVQLEAVSYQDVCDIEHYLTRVLLNNGSYNMTAIHNRWE